MPCFTGSGLKCDKGAFVDKMLPALLVQISDARSQIVREACGLISDIMPFLTNYHADVASILLPQLWKLTYVSVLDPTCLCADYFSI